jgi:hypothetical protein
MANFRLAKDARKEQTLIGKKVARAASGIASQKSASMWGGIGGGLAGAALMGIAGVSSVLTGGAAAPLWATMAATGVGAAVGSKAGEEVSERLTTGEWSLKGQADYEKASYIDPHKSKFFQEEVGQARGEIRSMSDQVAKSHKWTGVKAGMLSGASDILKGTKILGKGSASVGEVLKAEKGTFTSADALGKVAAEKAAKVKEGKEFASLVKDKALSSKELGTKRLAHLGFDKASVDAGDDALKAAAKSYTGASAEAKQRFFEGGAKAGGETDWSAFLTAEQTALDVAGEDAAGFLAKSYKSDMSMYNQLGSHQGVQNPIVAYKNMGLNVTQDASGNLDPVKFQGQVGGQLKSEIAKAYKGGMSVAEAEATTMAGYGMERNTLLESIFSKKKTGEWSENWLWK